MIPIARALAALAAGQADLSPLQVTYDDRHGLHGGLYLAIAGDGLVTQEAVRVRAGSPRRVTNTELRALVALLVQLEAWQQREIAPRQLLPDTSFSRLTIAYAEHTSTIWEDYNQLAKLNRIAQVRTLMQQIAWQPATG